MDFRSLFRNASVLRFAQGKSNLNTQIAFSNVRLLLFMTSLGVGAVYSSVIMLGCQSTGSEFYPRHMARIH